MPLKATRAKGTRPNRTPAESQKSFSPESRLNHLDYMRFGNPTAFVPVPYYHPVDEAPRYPIGPRTFGSFTHNATSYPFYY